MKLIEASGKTKLRMSKREWLEIGKKFVTKQAKKKKKKPQKKDWNPNPWAVCTKSVGDKAGTKERSKWPKKTKEKYERCVQEVKKNQK